MKTDMQTQLAQYGRFHHSEQRPVDAAEITRDRPAVRVVPPASEHIPRFRPRRRRAGIALWKRPLAVGAAVFVVVVALIVVPLFVTRNTEPPVTDPPTTTSTSSTTTTAAPSAIPEVYDVDWTYVEGAPDTISDSLAPILSTPTGFLQVVDELGGPKLRRSRDGISWADEAMPEGLGRTVPEAFQLGETFVLADRFLGKVLISTDGSTWTQEDGGSLPGLDSESCCIPGVVHYEGVEYEEFRTLMLPTPLARDRAMYVIGLNTGYAAYTLDNAEIREGWTSRDGKTWTNIVLEINGSPLRGLLLIERSFAVRDGEVMAAGIRDDGDGDYTVLLSSVDGVEWNEVVLERELLAVGLSATSHGWIMGGYSYQEATNLFFSTDGAEWLDLPTPLDESRDRQVSVAGDTVFFFEDPYTFRPDYVVASLDTLTRRTTQE